MTPFLTTSRLILGCVRNFLCCGFPLGCVTSVVGTVCITDLDFADDAVIFAETTEVLAEALESLSEAVDPLGLRVSWIETKVQALGSLLDATSESIPVSGENVEVTHVYPPWQRDSLVSQL